MEVMAGVRRTRAVSLLPEHQPVGAQYVVETVTPDPELTAEILTAQRQKLTAPRTGQPVIGTNPAAVHHDARHKYAVLRVSFHMLVIAITAYAKQSTERRLGVATANTAFLRQAINYLATDFFLIGML